METSKKSSVKSSKFSQGARTFFFDVNVASNNAKYLKITESRFTGEGKDRVRSSVVLFPENIQDFQKKVLTLSSSKTILRSIIKW